MKGIIKTISVLNQEIISSYIFAAIGGLVLVLLIFIIANMISWQGGSQDTSPAKRRWAFLVTGLLGAVALLAYEYFTVMVRIINPVFSSKYTLCMALSTLLLLAVYFLVSFIIMKIVNPDSKFASILPKKNK